MGSNNKSSAKSRKAQSTIEYAICIFAAVLAISAMVVYVKRGISGRYADVVRATAQSANSNQYEPYYQASHYTEDNRATFTEDIRNRGQKITDSVTDVVRQGESSVSGDPE
jgi:uncharacterized protein (UPF0333 family)